MSDTDMTAVFRATPVDAYSALEQAARLTGLQHLSGDASNGVIVFSSGLTALTFGEKVAARIEQVGADTVRVTLSSDVQFGMVGFGADGSSVDRLFAALVGILPAAE